MGFVLHRPVEQKRSFLSPLVLPLFHQLLSGREICKVRVNTVVLQLNWTKNDYVVILEAPYYVRHI